VDADRIVWELYQEKIFETCDTCGCLIYSKRKELSNLDSKKLDSPHSFGIHQAKQWINKTALLPRTLHDLKCKISAFKYKHDIDPEIIISYLMKKNLTSTRTEIIQKKDEYFSYSEAPSTQKEYLVYNFIKSKQQQSEQLQTEKQEQVQSEHIQPEQPPEHIQPEQSQSDKQSEPEQPKTETEEKKEKSGISGKLKKTQSDDVSTIKQYARRKKFQKKPGKRGRPAQKKIQDEGERLKRRRELRYCAWGPNKERIKQLALLKIKEKKKKFKFKSIKSVCKKNTRFWI